MNKIGDVFYEHKIILRAEKRAIVKQFSEEFLMLDYKLIGFKKCCAEILKCFSEFKTWVADYKKGAFK